MKTVGVLALQGDFDAHAKAVERAGGKAVLVRSPEDLSELDGLIIPGGESTTMLKLLHYENLAEPLAEFGRCKPVFGTCAGAILMAREVRNPQQESFNLMDIVVERNAYGRQVDSRVVEIESPELEKRTSPGKMEAVFIRAPIIREINDGVNVLAEYEGDPVLIEQGPHLVATFHPELTKDDRVHRLFLERL